MAYERDRGSARKRGYTPRWDKASATFKQRNPWCLGCQALGKRTPTEVPDHVIPHKGVQAVFWDTSKWQPACRWHHDVIKPKLERMYEEGDIGGADLWLNSASAVALSRKFPARQAVGADGWPQG